MTVRTYDPDADREALWSLKRAFELELGTETGSEGKADRYEGKLTEAYRERYMAWVDRCVEEDPDCVTLAVDDGEVVGYVFVLPETHAMIWDAAVLNELYLAPAVRGAGLADDLLEAAVALARAQSLPLDRLVLDVDPDNARAYAVYERHGFEPWGELVARELGP